MFVWHAEEFKMLFYGRLVPKDWQNLAPSPPRISVVRSGIVVSGHIACSIFIIFNLPSLESFMLGKGQSFVFF